MKDVILSLKNELGERNVFENEPMNKHTSFKAGGTADIFIIPENKSHIQRAIDILRENQVPFMVLGNGSNVLVSDEGYHGAVIQIYSKMCHVMAQDTIIEAKAGALLTVIAAKALENGLTGFEFASGIPGTLGGAICMNAGAYGSEIKNVLVSADVLTPDMQVKTYTAKELQLSYRHSLIPEQNLMVLSGKIRLDKGDKVAIKERMAELAQQRREKQPLNFPSAGSTFKRPEGYFAGKLIEDAGLKGYTIGMAQVSEKHSGFIVNKGGATAKDIWELIRYCQKVVYEKFGVQLETEVKLLGKF